MSTAMPNLMHEEQARARADISALSCNRIIQPAYSAKIVRMIDDATDYFTMKPGVDLYSRTIYQQYIEHSPRREVFWISEEFTNLLLDAAQDFEDETREDTVETTSIDTSLLHLPATDGMIVFEKPIVIPIAHEGYTQGKFGITGMPVRSLAWMPINRDEINETTGSTLPECDHVMFTGFHTLSSRGMERCTVLGNTISSLNKGKTIHTIPFDPASLIATFAFLLDQTNITRDEKIKLPSIAAPVVRGSKKKPKRIKQPDVRVITLNPRGTSKAVYERVVAEDDSELVTGKRDYQHKWMVRGHWRNQPYPSQGEGVTKPIWIAPYIKGPDDRPLLTTPRVHAIRHI